MQEATQSYYAHGKLLLTAEYLVLDGAKALAIPTQRGQRLIVTRKNSEDSIMQLHWQSHLNDGSTWFEARFGLQNNQLYIISSSDSKVAQTLLTLLEYAREKNVNFLSQKEHCTVHTHLEFPRHWGLGSSSTLISMIAEWAEVDPYDLVFNAFGGSGYDIACAQAKSPIYYTLTDDVPHSEPTLFNPKFRKNLFFVHLNQKQDSKASIKHYRSLSLTKKKEWINRFSQLTSAIHYSTDLSIFEALIQKHEAYLGQILRTVPVQKRLFSTYTSGVVKSLGGWGGDFVLATGTSQDMTYFQQKGYPTIIKWDEMVLKSTYT